MMTPPIVHISIDDTIYEGVIVKGPTSTGLLVVELPDGKKVARHVERVTPMTSTAKTICASYRE